MIAPTKMDTDALRPCPFCGGRAELVARAYANTGEVCEFAVACRDCNVKPFPCRIGTWLTGQREAALDERRRDAVAAWNLRPPGLSDRVEEAAGCLPDGCWIEVHVERGAGYVELWRDDDRIELSPDPQIEGGLAAAVADAIETAKRLAAAEG